MVAFDESALEDMQRYKDKLDALFMRGDISYYSVRKEGNYIIFLSSKDVSRKTFKLTGKSNAKQ